MVNVGADAEGEDAGFAEGCVNEGITNLRGGDGLGPRLQSPPPPPPPPPPLLSKSGANCGAADITGARNAEVDGSEVDGALTKGAKEGENAGASKVPSENGPEGVDVTWD